MYSKHRLSAFHPLKDENIREGVRSQFILAERGGKNPEAWLGARGFVLATSRMRLWARNRGAFVCLSLVPVARLPAQEGSQQEEVSTSLRCCGALAHVLPSGCKGNSFLLLRDVCVGWRGKKKKRHHSAK